LVQLIAVRDSLVESMSTSRQQMAIEYDQERGEATQALRGLQAELSCTQQELTGLRRKAKVRFG